MTFTRQCVAKALLRSGALDGRLLAGGRLANVAATTPEALEAISRQQQAGVPAFALGGARRAGAM